MVSFNVYRSTTSGFYVEGVCLITDEKPVVGIANGSILFAVDTSSGETTRFMYDQSTMSWIEAECPCSGGSGSGGSGGGNAGGPLIVRLSGEQKTADKTFGEIIEALASGRGAVALDLSERDWAGNPEYQPFVFARFGKNGFSATYVTFGITGNTEAHPSANSGADESDYPKFVGGVG